ncbi:MAG TPA: hypothetical protein VGJ92_11655 [Methanocella sp.]|jgi:hypothetical protein
MDEKYETAIKIGLICGIAPAASYIVYQFARFYGSGGALAALSGIIVLLAPAAAGILAVKASSPLLHKMKDVMLVSAVSGGVEGAIAGMGMAITGIIWQWAANYYAQNAHVDASYGFSLAAMPWEIPIVILIIAASMAVIAIIGGTIYAISKSPVKL